MSEQIVLGLLLIFFVVLYIVNIMVEKHKNKEYQNILKFMNKKARYIILEKSDLYQKEEWYKEKDFFKMHNTGTEITQYDRQIEYKGNEDVMIYDDDSQLSAKLNTVDTLKPLMNILWKLLQDGATAMRLKDENVEITGSEDAFKREFGSMYISIANVYMKQPKEALDRHKVAAIYMAAIIKIQMLSERSTSDKIFMGNYVLAADCGFIYMLSELNNRLQEKGQPIIECYFFPSAMACETDYYRIFYRNLYFSNNNNWSLNLLDIAEKLFLIEYITLEHNNIDSSILKEY